MLARCWSLLENARTDICVTYIFAVKSAFDDFGPIWLWSISCFFWYLWNRPGTEAHDISRKYGGSLVFFWCCLNSLFLCLISIVELLTVYPCWSRLYSDLADIELVIYWLMIGQQFRTIGNPNLFLLEQLHKNMNIRSFLDIARK